MSMVMIFIAKKINSNKLTEKRKRTEKHVRSKFLICLRSLAGTYMVLISISLSGLCLRQNYTNEILKEVQLGPCFGRNF